MVPEPTPQKAAVLAALDARTDAAARTVAALVADRGTREISREPRAAKARDFAFWARRVEELRRRGLAFAGGDELVAGLTSLPSDSDVLQYGFHSPVRAVVVLVEAVTGALVGFLDRKKPYRYLSVLRSDEERGEDRRLFQIDAGGTVVRSVALAGGVWCRRFSRDAPFDSVAASPQPPVRSAVAFEIDDETFLECWDLASSD